MDTLIATVFNHLKANMQIYIGPFWNQNSGDFLLQVGMHGHDLLLPTIWNQPKGNTLLKEKEWIGKVVQS